MDGINLAFLLCDSPCHGKQYYDGDISDDLADNIPIGTLENLMKSIFLKIKNLRIFCLKIRQKTDKMF